MKKRIKMTSKQSKKLFTKTALKTKPQNNTAKPMRGGIRL